MDVDKELTTVLLTGFGRGVKSRLLFNSSCLSPSSPCLRPDFFESDGGLRATDDILFENNTLDNSGVIFYNLIT